MRLIASVLAVLAVNTASIKVGGMHEQAIARSWESETHDYNPL